MNFNCKLNEFTEAAARDVVIRIVAYLKASDKFYRPLDMGGSPWHVLDPDKDTWGILYSCWDKYLDRQRSVCSNTLAELVQRFPDLLDLIPEEYVPEKCIASF